MILSNDTNAGGKWTLLGSVIVAALFFSSCEKKLDYTRPPDANTIKGDIDSAFSNLTQGVDVSWAWKFSLTLYGNNFPEMLLHFDKDSTADAYSIAPRGIVYDLMALRSSGTLTTAQSTEALSLINAFNSFKDDDYTLRSLLEATNNASFKNRLLVLLPNYINFAGQQFYTEELNVRFDVNSVVQTSLTFQQSDLFPLFKQFGIVDFDFRLMKFSKDSILLSSYKNDLENVNTTLYPFNLTSVAPFIAASTVLVWANPLKVNVTARLNGTPVPVPAGYNSVLDFFYRSYNQAFSPKHRAHGFMSNGLGTAAVPAALKDVVFFVPTGAYAGIVGTAPSGTVLATFAAAFPNGSTQPLEFVKN